MNYLLLHREEKSLNLHLKDIGVSYKKKRNVRMFDRIEQVNFLLTYFKQRASFLIMRQLSLYRSSSHVSPAEESSGKIREKV